jgi:lysophospholipase
MILPNACGKRLASGCGCGYPLAMAHQPQTDPLLRRRTLPDGGAREFRAMRDGWPVRTLRWAARDGRPTILLAGGRADFIEKYAETIHDLVDDGWGVASFDWRGQGLSRRLGQTPQHGASPGFDVWLADLAELIDWAGDGAPLPVIAHSMGGHLLLRHLAAGGQGVARAALLSPMTGLAAKPLGPWLARLVARWQVQAGKGGDYVLGGGPWQPGRPGERRQEWLTTSVERYVDESWWIGQYPSLALGSVTWGWLDDAFASIAALVAPGVPEAIGVPVLALIPERDALVDSVATRRLVARIPGARLEAFAGAGHELLREAEPMRSDVLRHILQFLGQAS